MKVIRTVNSTVGSEIQLISDGEGMMVIGKKTDIDDFLSFHNINDAPTRDLDFERLTRLLNTGAKVAKVGSDLSASSGRWVKLTKESAKAMNEHGLMPTKTPGVSYAMIGKPGKTQKWLQLSKGPSAIAAPVLLPALATLMQQQAIQQQMDAIVDYLAVVEEKVDTILRAQNDAVLADMIGVDLVVNEALTVRETVGRVSEVTWSKVQACSQTVARTQAYAVKRLEALTQKLEKISDLGELAKATRKAEPEVQEWLALLAQCFQLQDGIDVLELDRVLDGSPDELDRHRIGLSTARQNRLDRISRSTYLLIHQMTNTIEMANSKVLFNPFDSPAVVRSSNLVTGDILSFHSYLGVESEPGMNEAKRWGQAVVEVGDKIVAASVEGATTVKHFGNDTFERTADIFRPIDIDGDGVPDKSRATMAVEDAGSTIINTASNVAGKLGKLFQRSRE